MFFIHFEYIDYVNLTVMIGANIACCSGKFCHKKLNIFIISFALPPTWWVTEIIIEKKNN